MNYRGDIIVHWILRTSRAEVGPSSGPNWKRTRLELKMLGLKMKMGPTVLVRESDTEPKSDVQLNKIFMAISMLRENLSVLACPNNWKTGEIFFWSSKF